jgi:hypothetical protein
MVFNADDLCMKLSFTIMAILLELYPKFEQADEEQPHMAALRTFIMVTTFLNHKIVKI